MQHDLSMTANRTLRIALLVAQFVAASPLAADEAGRPPADGFASFENKIAQTAQEDPQQPPSPQDMVVSCGSSPRLDRFEIWKEVDGHEAALDLLRRKYAELNSPRALALWLACQGFWVDLGPDVVRNAPRGTQLLRATFNVPENGGKPLWRRFPPWPKVYAQSFHMIFDHAGSATRLEYGETIK